MPKFRSKPTGETDIARTVDQTVMSFARGDADVIKSLSSAKVTQGHDFVLINFSCYENAINAFQKTSIKIQGLSGEVTVRYLFKFWYNQPSCQITKNFLRKQLDPQFTPIQNECSCYTCEKGWTYK